MSGDRSAPWWPLPHRPRLRDRLLDAYGEGRGYHDRRHLAEVLDRVDELGCLSDPELVLAAWFHDAVYAGSDDDEERSARLAEAELAGEDLDVEEVVRLVRLTRQHDPSADDRRGHVLCDADLAILAAEPARYASYAAGVRADHAAVSDEDFRAGRLAVLQELLARPALFHTEHGRRHWDGPARKNLTAEIDRLS